MEFPDNLNWPVHHHEAYTLQPAAKRVRSETPDASGSVRRSTISADRFIGRPFNELEFAVASNHLLGKRSLPEPTRYQDLLSQTLFGPSTDEMSSRSRLNLRDQRRLTPISGNTALDGRNQREIRINVCTDLLKILDAPELSNNVYHNPLDMDKDGSIVVALNDALYHAKRVSTGSIVHSELYSQSETEINTVHLDYDGRQVAFATKAGSLQLVDVATQQSQMIVGPLNTDVSESIVTLVQHGEHEWLTGSNTGLVKVYDTRVAASSDGNIGIQGHTNGVCKVAQSPLYPHLVASGGIDDSARVWDLRNPDTPLLDLEHTAAVLGLDFHPQKNLLATGAGTSDACLRVLNCDSGILRDKIRTNGQVTNCLWSPHHDWRIVTTPGFDGNGIVSVWDRSFDMAPLKEVAQLKCDSANRVLFAAKRPRGAELVTASDDESIRIWSPFERSYGPQKKRAAGPRLLGSTLR